MFNIKKWIANTPIFNRLLLASVIVAIIPGLVISLLGGTYIQALNARGHAVQVSTDAVKVATTQLANLQHMNADLIALQSERFVATSINGTQDVNISQLEQTLTNEINALQTNIDQALVTYQRDYEIATSGNMESIRNQLASNSSLNSVANDQQSTLKRVLPQEWQDYSQAQSGVLQALKANQPSTQAYQLLLTANNKYAPLEKDWQHIVDLAETIGDKVAQVEAAQKNPLIMLALIAILIILAVVVIIGYIVNLTIAQPLHQLARLTRRISKGETNARVPILGNDEIYLVARSMNGMLDSIVQLIQEAEEQRDILQAQIEKLMGEVMGIGGGDLQVQAEVMPGSLGVLAEFFNYMIEALSSLVIRVKKASYEVEVSTTATFNVLVQLVKTSDLQLSEIGEATVEVEQMANSTRQVASRTDMLYNVAHEAQSAIQKGRQSVKQAVEGMQRIHENIQETAQKVLTVDEHSSEINNIVAVIANIAQRMNRLAYAAAEQAAKAGEHGRGFGVVAIDIQRLAERTNSQVASIEQIAQGVQEDISAAALSIQNTERESSHGAKLAEEAGVAMETIFAAVEHQAREMNVINHTATQQLQSFNAIVNIIHLIVASTQQISTSTRKAAQNLEYLTRQVEELRTSVAAFKLRQVQSQSVSAFTSDSGMTNSGMNVQSGHFKRFRSTTPPPDSGSGVRHPLPPAKSVSAHLRIEPK